MCMKVLFLDNSPSLYHSQEVVVARRMLRYQGNFDSTCLRSYHSTWKLSRIWLRLSWVRLWSGWFRFSWSPLGPWLSAYQPYCWPCSTQGISWCWLWQHLKPLQFLNNGKVVFCISHRLFWYCLSLFTLVHPPYEQVLCSFHGELLCSFDSTASCLWKIAS